MKTLAFIFCVIVTIIYLIIHVVTEDKLVLVQAQMYSLASIIIALLPKEK